MTSAEMHYLNCADDNCERAYCVGRRDFERKTGDIEHLELLCEKLGPFFRSLIESGHVGAVALKNDIEAFIEATEKDMK